MNCKALLIAAAASASILGLSGLASAQVTQHIQSGAGHSGRMITGREVYAPHFRAPFVSGVHRHYRHRYWRNGRWFYEY